MATRETTRRRAQDRGKIDRNSVYPLGTFLLITRMGKKGFREARASGLRVVYHSRTAFVTGEDFAEWLSKPGRRTEPLHAPPQT